MVAYEGDVKRRNALSGADKAQLPAPFDLRTFVAEHNAARRARATDTNFE
jgi:hypothetical protein